MNYLSLDEAIILHNDIMKQMQGLVGFNKAQVGYLQSANKDELKAFLKGILKQI